MDIIVYKGIIIYRIGRAVPGYRLNVWQGVNAGAWYGMDDYGNVGRHVAEGKPYGLE